MATAAKMPSVPPRPSRSQEKAPLPAVPPRPIPKRKDRDLSPNPDRFAPSPLNEYPFGGAKSPRSLRFNTDDAQSSNGGSSKDGARSVDMPSVGEEGVEYAGLAEQLSKGAKADKPAPVDPDTAVTTSTVGEDMHIHAPKPSLPASTTRRLMTVTRTDSEKAASFGIGKAPASSRSAGESSGTSNDGREPSSTAPAPPSSAQPGRRDLRKKASTASQLSARSDSYGEDELGIPEIGIQGPLCRNAGDVQAPSPAPPSSTTPSASAHKRGPSAMANLPPGSYGMHGHGVLPHDKLTKAYYEKHPELLKKEHVIYQHDRPTDFSMSGEDLNRLVRESGSRRSSFAPGSTPSEQVGWQAMAESTSRVTSPAKHQNQSPELQKSSVIHIDDPDDPDEHRSVFSSSSDTPEASAARRRNHRTSSGHSLPILAEDEVAKYSRAEPAAVFDIDAPKPASTGDEAPVEIRVTSGDDVEYEPLFKNSDQAKKDAAPADDKGSAKSHHCQRFPSRDVWEDAPDSVHFTAEVSTPEFSEESALPSKKPFGGMPSREGAETPAQAFARQQEQLAAQEAEQVLESERHHQPGQPLVSHQPTPAPTPRNEEQRKKTMWAMQHTPELASSGRPAAHRFPSRDVWEDVPDSLRLETTVSGPQRQDSITDSPVVTAEPASKPGVPQRPQKAPAAKPPVPERPNPRRTSTEEAVTGSSQPAVTDRPKPHIPARPSKSSRGLSPSPATAQDAAAESSATPPAVASPAARTKPTPPARLKGSKIAALQAGFMNDLNNRLKLGPQAPPAKKEDAEGDDAAAEGAPAVEKEKIPLTDARKGRARGPQRRAPPAKSASPAPAAAAAAGKDAAKAFTMSLSLSVWELDPEQDVVALGRGSKPEAAPAEKASEPEPRQDDKTSEVDMKAEAAASKESIAEQTPAASEGPGKESASAAETSTEPAAVKQPGEASAELEKRPELAEQSEAERSSELEKPEPEPKQLVASEDAPATEKTETLATNMAGEPVAVAHVKDDGDSAPAEAAKVEAEEL